MMLRADRFYRVHLLGGRVCRGRHFGQHVEADVAAGFGPFVVLLHEHRADQPDDGLAAGEDADHIGAAAQLAVEPLRVGRPHLAPDLARHDGEGEQVIAGIGQVGGGGRQPSLQDGTTRSNRA
jgi:hypothetical protein